MDLGQGQTQIPISVVGFSMDVFMNLLRQFGWPDAPHIRQRVIEVISEFINRINANSNRVRVNNEQVKDNDSSNNNK